MALLIKNAHVYTPADAGIKDVLIVNDRVAAVEDNLTVTMPDLATLDAKGLILTPGFIDQHIHVTGGGGEAGHIAHNAAAQGDDKVGSCKPMA